jgi:hypothetical protein
LYVICIGQKTSSNNGFFYLASRAKFFNLFKNSEGLIIISLENKEFKWFSIYKHKRQPRVDKKVCERLMKAGFETFFL